MKTYKIEVIGVNPVKGFDAIEGARLSVVSKVQANNVETAESLAQQNFVSYAHKPDRYEIESINHI